MLGSLNTVDIKLLKMFIVVVEARGLAAAQTHLNLNLSTISQHLGALEERLGIVLCSRGRSGFELTREGKRVYEIARRLSGTLEDTRAELAGLRDRLIGTLKIAIVDNIANNPEVGLDQAIASFDARPNQVQITVEVVSPLDLERLVVDGTFDVGLGPSLQRKPSLAYLPLMIEKQYLYCSDRNALYNEQEAGLTVSKIKSARFIGHICPIYGENIPPELSAESTGQHMEGIAILILSGRYIGYLPKHYADQWVSSGKMKTLKPKTFRYTNDFQVFFRKNSTDNPVIKSFIAEIEKLAPRTPA